MLRGMWRCTWADRRLPAMVTWNSLCFYWATRCKNFKLWSKLGFVFNFVCAVSRSFLSSSSLYTTPFFYSLSHPLLFSLFPNRGVLTFHLTHAHTHTSLSLSLSLSISLNLSRSFLALISCPHWWKIFIWIKKECDFRAQKLSVLHFFTLWFPPWIFFNFSICSSDLNQFHWYQKKTRSSFTPANSQTFAAGRRSAVGRNVVSKARHAGVQGAPPSPGPKGFCEPLDFLPFLFIAVFDPDFRKSLHCRILEEFNEAYLTSRAPRSWRYMNCLGPCLPLYFASYVFIWTQHLLSFVILIDAIFSPRFVRTPMYTASIHKPAPNVLSLSLLKCSYFISLSFSPQTRAFTVNYTHFIPNSKCRNI